MSIKGVNPVPFVLLIITTSAVIAIPSLAPVAAYAPSSWPSLSASRGLSMK